MFIIQSMATPPESRWNSHRGDDWWWSGPMKSSGTLNFATSTFEIDNLVEGTPRNYGHYFAPLASSFQIVRFIAAAMSKSAFY